VRVEVTVAPDGAVKKVRELGGNPVLVDAFIRAVKQWKYETAAKESVFEVKFEFIP
jgi:membrane protein involved in colicin uptake